jgi:succinate dehydrogenase / fumarate reductase membrane anchor subunit
MVKAINRKGLRDWIIQRITALIVGIYAVIVVIFALSHSSSSDQAHEWMSFLSHPAMKIAGVLALVSVLWHAWLGLWIVFTDYVKPLGLRYFLNTVVLLLLLAYLVWGLVGLFRGGL